MARDKKRKSQAADRRRPIKKKTSILTSESVDWVDYKDVNLLRRFMSERAKIPRARHREQRPAAARGGAGDPYRAGDGPAAVQLPAGDATQPRWQARSRSRS